MLHIQSFTFNPFQENTYIIYNDASECWIVDPGMYDSREEQEIFNYIDKNNLTPKEIINTHAHIDHIIGIEALKARYNIPFGLHELEKPVLANATVSAAMFGIDMRQAPQADFYIDEGKDYPIGTDSLSIRLVPGHSPGSILYYYELGKWAIVGDAIFNGSIGRTDLPGGDFATLERSIIESIYSLPDDTTLYCGHGSNTTVSRERVTNPFVKG